MKKDNISPITISEDFKVAAETHCINVSIAKEVGLVESIILSHFFFWHQCNNGNEDYCKDGKVWFFKSVSQICEMYPYLSNEKVKRAIERLLQSGLIYKRANDDNGLKKANLYALSPLVLSWYECPKTPNDGYNTQRGVQYPTKDSSIEDSSIEDKEKEEIDKSIPKKKKNPTTNLDLSFIDETFLPIIQDWLDYKREKGQTYKQRGVQALYTRIRTLSGNNATKAKQIVEQSIANNWAGVFGIKQTTQDVVDKYTRLTGDRQKVIEESDHTEW